MGHGRWDLVFGCSILHMGGDAAGGYREWGCKELQDMRVWHLPRPRPSARMPAQRALQLQRHLVPVEQPILPGHVPKVMAPVPRIPADLDALGGRAPDLVPQHRAHHVAR
ncbi:Hypothetical protein TPAR_09544, partial [Tolypocladium paradoxum]